MIYKFGERLTEISQEEWEKEKCPAVFLTDSIMRRRHWQQ